MNLLIESTNLVIAALLCSNQWFYLLCGTQVLRNAGLHGVEHTPTALPWWWSPLCSILFISINTLSLPTWCIGLQMGHLVRLGWIEIWIGDLWSYGHITPDVEDGVGLWNMRWLLMFQRHKDPSKYQELCAKQYSITSLKTSFILAYCAYL